MIAFFMNSCGGAISGVAFAPGRPSLLVLVLVTFRNLGDALVQLYRCPFPHSQLSLIGITPILQSYKLQSVVVGSSCELSDQRFGLVDCLACIHYIFCMSGLMGFQSAQHLAQ